MATRKPKKDPLAEVSETIAAMSVADSKIAEPLHDLIRQSAPELEPRLWYAQPAYAKGGKVVVFFRGADHDGERYFTLGFTQHAPLDDGDLWPTAYAVRNLGAATRKAITDLVMKAAR